MARKFIPSIRIGNGISITWKIFSGTEPYSLEGQDVILILANGQYQHYVNKFAVVDNTIQFTFFGKGQVHLGDYSLILIINNNLENMKTVDNCEAFTLVACSCESDLGNATGIAALELNSLVQIGSAGTQDLSEYATKEELKLKQDVIIGVDYNEDFNEDFTN